ncbi:MAG TPA: oligoribonuclease [Candidatus Paceibacterota bacterium]
MQRDDLLLWMDLEMTSLEDARFDKIIEIATVLTDKNLNIVAEGPDIVIHTERTAFDRITEKVLGIHQRSGIIGDAEKSAVTEKEAEEQTLAFIKEHTTQGSAPLCGNSIWVDRHFLRMRMPSIHDYIDYHCIDVSTIKQLAKRWAPETFTKLHKSERHRAKDDVMESIAELKFWRSEVLKI